MQLVQVRSEEVVPLTSTAWLGGHCVMGRHWKALIWFAYVSAMQVWHWLSVIAEGGPINDVPGPHVVQGVHTGMLATLVKVPFKHPWQARSDDTVLATTAKFPGGHWVMGTHCTLLMAEENMLSWQGVQPRLLDRVGGVVTT
jgi:hypothetical protein